MTDNNGTGPVPGSNPGDEARPADSQPATPEVGGFVPPIPSPSGPHHSMPQVHNVDYGAGAEAGRPVDPGTQVPANSPTGAGYPTGASYPTGAGYPTGGSYPPGGTYPGEANYPGAPAYGGEYGPFAANVTPPPVAPKRRAVKQRVWPAVLAAAILGGGVGAGGTMLLVGENIAPLPGTAESSNVSVVGPAVAGAPDWSTIAQRVRASVVSLQVTTAQGTALGSGSIIDSAGHVLTNNHVVAGGTKIQILLYDGRIYNANMVGTDPTTDLAVVKIVNPPKDLTVATLGSSKNLTVGEPVMAVGNPLGLSSTVTTGIISALDRPVLASDGSQSTTATVTNAIQIDASINPGNSGGPLFDSGGSVIGVNSSIATTSKNSGSVGLGFAIPVDLAKQISDQLISTGVAEHAFLGVTLSDSVATSNGVTRLGAKVESVQPGTPAAAAGVRPGDVIVGINDQTVSSAESLTGWVRTFTTGEHVTLQVIRSGQTVQLQATLTTRPEQ